MAIIKLLQHWFKEEIMVIIKTWLLCVLGINIKKQMLDYTELSDLMMNTMDEHSIL